ncbi:hypothetical protein DJ79_08250 [Halorubrum ezzemoulense]|uniref:Uncharacterized protein n=1 Tax=Halorubrum ezzemoulense TaxID=337243 RepID=A0A256JHN1_HALEZ|nr:inositol monophosphatase family protein [Halorubrum ezzemoulense]OYR67787.1 hypothetical protein DJ79_08250 [Halorubrum ezzemoulense]
MTDADERGADSGGREEVPAPAARADDVDERAAVAKRAAEAGAAVANEGFRSDIAVETKGEDDVVTEADRAAQRAVIESIRESYPDDAVVGAPRWRTRASGATSRWRRKARTTW